MNRLAHRIEDQASAPARFTAEEFLRMAERGAFDDMKVELDHGEILRMNPPYAPHGTMLARVIGALMKAARGSDLTVSGEAGILIADDTVYAFDAGLVRGDIPAGRFAPDQLCLIVEVADTSLERDLGAKAREYAAAGIETYWVVDVKARVIHVFTGPSSGEYRTRGVVRFGEPLELPEGLGTIVLE